MAQRRARTGSRPGGGNPRRLHRRSGGRDPAPGVLPAVGGPTGSRGRRRRGRRRRAARHRRLRQAGGRGRDPAPQGARRQRPDRAPPERPSRGADERLRRLAPALRPPVRTARRRRGVGAGEQGADRLPPLGARREPRCRTPGVLRQHAGPPLPRDLGQRTAPARPGTAAAADRVPGVRVRRRNAGHGRRIRHGRARPARFRRRRRPLPAPGGDAVALHGREPRPPFREPARAVRRCPRRRTAGVPAGRAGAGTRAVHRLARDRRAAIRDARPTVRDDEPARRDRRPIGRNHRFTGRPTRSPRPGNRTDRAAR